MRHNTSPILGAPAWRAFFVIGALFAATTTIGCEDDAQSPAPTATADAAKQEVAPSGPIEALSAPDAVVLYGGVDDASGLAEKLKKAYPDLGTGLDPKMMSAALAERYELSDPSVVELEKPMRFALLDPKKNDDPVVLLVPTKGKDALEKALPAEKKKDEAGNAFTVKTSRGDVYVNMIDTWAVFASNKEAFKAHRDFLVKLAGAKLAQPAMLVVDAENTAKIFGEDLEKGLAAMKTEVEGQPGMTASSVAGISSMFDGMGEVAKDADKVVMMIAPLDDGALLKADIHPKKGSPLADTFAELGDQKLDLLDEAPVDAPVVVAWSMDPDKAGELTKSLWRWSLQFMGTGETDAKYTEAMETYWRATDGDVLAVAHRLEGDASLRFSMIFGVRDAAKAREAQDTLKGLYAEPSLQKSYRDMGIQMRYQRNAYKVGDVAVSTITTDVKSDGGIGKLGSAGALFSSLLTQHFAVGEEIGVVAYGTDGKKAVQAWLEGKVEGGFGGTTPAKQALEKAAPGTFFLAYAQAGPIAQALKGDAPAGDAKPEKQAPEARGIVISAGAKGGVLQIVVDLPQSQVAAVQQAIGGMPGGI